MKDSSYVTCLPYGFLLETNTIRIAQYYFFYTNVNNHWIGGNGFFLYYLIEYLKVFKYSKAMQFQLQIVFASNFCHLS